MGKVKKEIGWTEDLYCLRTRSLSNFHSQNFRTRMFVVMVGSFFKSY